MGPTNHNPPQEPVAATYGVGCALPRSPRMNGLKRQPSSSLLNPSPLASNSGASGSPSLLLLGPGRWELVERGGVCSIMATGLCGPANSVLSFSSPATRASSSPPMAAFVHAGRAVSSRSITPELTRLRWSRAGDSGRGSSGRRRLSVCCGVPAIDQTEFGEKVLQSDVPVLVEFVADWCGPCRLIAPVIEWASQEYGDRLKIVKIDHDENPQLIEEYKVYGLPALILFKDGQEVPTSRREGAITKAKLKEYLDSLLESTTVANLDHSIGL